MIRSDDIDTMEVLRKTRDFALEEGVEDVIVASTSGDTGVKAGEVFEDDDMNLVVIGHCTGFKEENEQQMKDKNIRKIEDLGGEVFIGPMVSHNVNISIRNKEGFSQHDLVFDTLRLFGQGTKVALESVLMACDAGLVDSGKDVIGIGGTDKGADTSLLVRSSNSMNLFDSRIREVILKPSKPENLIYY